MPCLSEWNTVHKPLVSIQMLLPPTVPEPAVHISFSKSFSWCFFVAVFLFGSFVAHAWIAVTFTCCLMVQFSVSVSAIPSFLHYHLHTHFWLCYWLIFQCSWSVRLAELKPWLFWCWWHLCPVSSFSAIVTVHIKFSADYKLLLLLTYLGCRLRGLSRKPLWIFANLVPRTQRQRKAVLLPASHLWWDFLVVRQNAACM